MPAFISPTSSRSAGTLVHRLRFGRLRVDDRAADVAERVVHRVRERVDGRRLAFARDDQAAAARVLQILDERTQPASEPTRAPSRRRRRRRRAAPPPRAQTRSMSDGAKRQSVIGLACRYWSASSRPRRADCVWARSPSSRRRDANARACAARRCPVQRKSASSDRMTSAFSIEYCGVDVLAEREAAAFARVVAAERLPLNPLRLRETRPGTRRSARRASATPRSR